MPSVSLPKFSFAQRVVPETAKIDQLQIDIGDWVLSGNENGIGSFVGFLGGCPGEVGLASYTSSWRETDPDYFGWLFNVPKGREWGRRRLDFRGNGRGTGSVKAGIPLAQGYLKVENLGPQSDEQGRKRLRFVANLNPTRYIRHQVNCWEGDRPPSEWNWRTSFKTRSLPLQNSSHNLDAEAALDGKDNVILTNRGLAFAGRRVWQRHMANYLLCFHEAVFQEFRRVAERVWPGDSMARHLTHGPYFRPRKIEVYWEFASSDPVRDVRRLYPKFSALGDTTYFTEYPIKLWNFSVQGNSPCLRIALPGQLQMRIYAKTTHRIRVEVVFDFKNNSVREMVNDDGRSSITTSEIPVLFGWFSSLYARAAETFNLVFAELEEESTESASPARITDLVAAIYNTIDNRSRALNLLRLLVENGRITTLRGSEMVKDVQKLRRKGVLRRSLGSDMVTAKFRRALRKLRKGEGVI